jgi:anionic cell wall polymer biosynthesis LytR-Cps2A-Psr (LCP) family protein
VQPAQADTLPALPALPAITPTIPILLQNTPFPTGPNALPLSTPACGLTAPMKLLYINLGKDGERSSSQAVRMIGINPSDKSVNVVSFPCDLWITTPSLVNNYTISAIRLCSLIQLVKNSTGKNPGTADIAKAIDTGLSDTFHVKSDHYLITTTDSLMKSVDLLNNIDYISPETTTLSGIKLIKGSNSIDSSAIFSLFSANPQDATSWDTLDRQNNVLTAIDQKFISSSSITLHDLIQGSNSESDLSDQDMASLECTLKNIPSDQIKFSDILKGNTTTATDGSINLANLPKILDEMNKLFAGAQQNPVSPSPTANNTGAVTPSQAQPTASEIQITPPVLQFQPIPESLPGRPLPPATGPTPTPTAIQSSGALDGKALVDNYCTQCHGLSQVQKKHTPAEWQSIIADMVKKGATLNSAEQDAVFQYLSTTYAK